MSKQRIASNLLVMGTGQIITWTLTTLYLVLVSRYLGPYRQGELSLAASIVSVLGLVVGLGMDTLITRTVARRPERSGPLASAAILTRVFLAIPALAVLYIYAHVAHLNGETRLTAYVMALSMVLGSISDVLLALFQGHERMSLSALGTIAQNTCILGLAIIAMTWLHGGVAAFAVISVIVALVLLALDLYWIRPYACLTWRVTRRDIHDVIVGSLAFWANTIFLTIYIYIDSIILGALAGTAAVGIYAPAARMFSVALFLPSIVGSVTLPLLSRLGVDAGADFVRVSRKTLSLLGACAVPLTVGVATFAGPLILAVFGPSYRSSAPVLVVLSLCIPCTFLNIQAGQTLAARDQQWRWTLIMAVSCAVNPLLNLVLIPLAQAQWHNGALGAAWSLLATEMLMATYAAIVMRDILCDRALARSIGAALVAGGAQLLTVWLTAQLWAPLGEALGAVAYGAVAIALGLFPREDMALLWQIVVRRSHSRAGRVTSGEVAGPAARRTG